MAKLYAFYLAAPFFNDEQREVCQAIEDAAKNAGVRCFSPRRDAGVLRPDSSEFDRRAVFNHNLIGLRNSKYVLARIDDFDPGVLWEIGYAYALQVPIVAFSTVPGRGLNLMLAQSAIGFISELSNVLLFLRSGVKDAFDWTPVKRLWEGEIQ